MKMNSFNAQKAYLVTCSKSFILGHGQGLKEDKRETDHQRIVLVRLTHLLLRNVENLGFFKSLKICILADNFISNIDALIECVNLVKLDLKGNQITQLPNGIFWEALKNLQLLNLHDNNMATRKNIQGLASCQSLTALTLYDTPLSLKGNYRHCIVNSIWSLKALDNYVISDEEIIENCCLPFRFKSLNTHFYLNLYPSSKKVSYQSEMKTVHRMISAINRMQSLHSPILIIQRCVRGYLTRKGLRLLGVIPYRRDTEIESDISQKLNNLPLETSCELNVKSEEIQNERWVKECQKKEERDVKIKRLYVNLKKLVQTVSLEDLQVKASLASIESRKQIGLSLRVNTLQSKKIKPSRAKHIDGEDLSGPNSFFKEELGKLGFRVQGFQAVFHKTEPVRDMLLSRCLDGQDIRSAIRYFHSMQSETPRTSHPRPPVINAMKRLVSSRSDSVIPAPFHVCELAYRKKEEAEALRRRGEQVIQCKSRREDAKTQRLCLLDARRREVVQEKESEQAQLESARALLKGCRDREVQAAKEKHVGFIEEKRIRATEWTLVRAFNCHHTSLSRAINKHNTRQRQSDTQQGKRDLVNKSKMQAQSQRKLIQGYLEDRKQYMKNEAITSRAHRDTYLATKHNYQLHQAQARVAILKASHAKMEVLQPVPVNQSS